jgi:hypothetical protein
MGEGRQVKEENTRIGEVCHGDEGNGNLRLAISVMEKFL